MTEQLPGDLVHDAAQGTTTARVPASATTAATTAATTTTTTKTKTTTTAAAATAIATAISATPLARSSENGDNTPADSAAVPQQPATLLQHPSLPLTLAPASVHRLPSEECQPSQHQPSQPLPPDYHPYYSLVLEPTHDEFYDILGELDPYRTTPKEFIHLLVHAAARDRKIAEALVSLNSDRINNPSSWRPPLPSNFVAQSLPPLCHFPSQPWPGTSAPISHPPNANACLPAAPPPAQEDATSLIHPRKRRRDEAAEQHAAPAPATSQFRVNCHRMVMFSGPQQPPPPATHTKQPRNPAIVQFDVAGAHGLPPTPLPEQQDVSRPATISTPPPSASAQSVAPTSDTNNNDKVTKPINGDKKASYAPAT